MRHNRSGLGARDREFVGAMLLAKPDGAVSSCRCSSLARADFTHAKIVCGEAQQ